jgi:glycerophosphoryl diester phosphodiesterase
LPAIGILLLGLAAMSSYALDPPQSHNPLIIGHRGAPGHLPDHTLESYRLAIELGADYIEPDLVATKDGILIARHDVDLGATTNVADHPEFAARRTVKTVDGVRVDDWFADDFTLTEIKTLRARQPLPFRPKAFDDRYPIPTFEEIVRLALEETRRLGRPVGIYPETKHPSYHREAGLDLESPLLAVLARYGLDRPDAPVMIQSFEVSNLKALRGKTPLRLIQLIDADAVTRDGVAQPNRPYDFALRGDVRTYADLISRPGLREIASYADGIGPWKRYLTDCAGSRSADETRAGSVSGTPCLKVNDAHQAGLLVHPWTFRDETRYLAEGYGGDPVREYLAFFRLGVDGVFSDFPDTAVRARRQWRR